MSNKLQLEKILEIKYRDKIVENNKNASASDESSWEKINEYKMALNNMVNVFDLKSNNYENCSTESKLTFTYLYSIYKLSYRCPKRITNEISKTKNKPDYNKHTNPYKRKEDVLI